MNLMGAEEYWGSLPGYQGRYEVSSHGRIRSIPLPGTPQLAKILDPSSNPRGSLYVNLTLPGRRPRCRMVSHLVLETFLGTPAYHNRRAVHKDGSKANCRLDNLKWQEYRPKINREARHGFTTWGTRLRGSSVRSA